MSSPKVLHRVGGWEHSHVFTRVPFPEATGSGFGIERLKSAVWPADRPLAVDSPVRVRRCLVASTGLAWHRLLLSSDRYPATINNRVPDTVNLFEWNAC